MKKLFLYVLLFVGIFSLCFLLANEYFKQRMQEKEGQKLELAADSISIDTEWKDNGFYYTYIILCFHCFPHCKFILG